jgi:hypothetical protein
MSNIATTLLDFILDLLRDPQKAQEFNSDPHAALTSAGLGEVTPHDVTAVMPMVADCSPVRDWHGAVGGYHHYQPTGVSDYHPRPVEHEQDHEHDQGVQGAEQCHDDDHKPAPGPDHEPEHQGQEYAVIQHLQYIQNNYSFTEIDASHSIWAGGDANVLFGDNNVLGTNGSVVLDHATNLGSIDVDNSHTSVDVDVKDSFNGSFNSADGDGAVAGNGNEVDDSTTTTTTTTTTSDSHDTTYDNFGDVNQASEGSQAGTEGSQIGDNSLTISDNNVAVDGSQIADDGGQAATNGGQNADDGGQVADDGGQNADHGGTTIDDSFNPTDSFDHTDTDTDVNVHVDDVNLVDDSPGAVVGNDVDVDHSLNGNELAGDDIDHSHDFLSDNLSDNTVQEHAPMPDMQELIAG